MPAYAITATSGVPTDSSPVMNAPSTPVVGRGTGTGTPNTDTSGSPVPVATNSADPSLADQRSREFTSRLTRMTWELATRDSNPATDLVICLERHRDVGFRYVDVPGRVQIVHGTEDRRVPVANVRWLAEQMNGVGAGAGLRRSDETKTTKSRRRRSSLSCGTIGGRRSDSSSGVTGRGLGSSGGLRVGSRDKDKGWGAGKEDAWDRHRCEVRVLDGEGHGLMASPSIMGDVLTEIAGEWAGVKRGFTGLDVAIGMETARAAGTATATRTGTGTGNGMGDGNWWRDWREGMKTWVGGNVDIGGARGNLI